jgi:hypothetical protein
LALGRIDVGRWLRRSGSGHPSCWASGTVGGCD